MLDGTPILDIKPYLSSVPTETLRRGWLAEAEPGTRDKSTEWPWPRTSNMKANRRARPGADRPRLRARHPGRGVGAPGGCLLANRRVELVSFGLLASLYGMRILTGVPALEPLFGMPERSMLFTTAFIVYALPVAGLVYAEQIRGTGLASSLRRLVASRPGAGGDLHRLRRRQRPTLGVAARLPAVRDRRHGGAAAARVLWRHRDRVENDCANDRHGVAGAGGHSRQPDGVSPAAVAGVGRGLRAQRVLAVARRRHGPPLFRRSARAGGRRKRDGDRAVDPVVDSPDASPAVANFEIAARFVPARSVGGDMYDFLPVDERRVAVLIADVTGTACRRRSSRRWSRSRFRRRSPTRTSRAAC